MPAVPEKATCLQLHRFTWCLALLAIFCCTYVNTRAQNCPPNIGFETGTFANWTCSFGTVRTIGNTNVISLSPVATPMPFYHEMLPVNSTINVDPYGNFPVICPNGGGHSILLGNDNNYGFAQGVSYEFTIPPGQNDFILTYNYALVFSTGSMHRIDQQPRFEVQVLDVTDGLNAPCGFFSFIADGINVPGFMRSDDPIISYKSWTAVSVDLSNRAGKTIRLSFKVAGCTEYHPPLPFGPSPPSGYFAYAYIDVNAECNNALSGSVFCSTDTVAKVEAPYGYGYANYTWFDSALTQVLGTGPVITFRPPPPSGTTVAVRTQPDSYFGCPLTRYVRLVDTLRVTADAGADRVICNSDTRIRIGSAQKYGHVYKWAPATGLSNPNISNPIANPSVTTRYVLTVTSSGGGTCKDMDTVEVKVEPLSNALQVIGSPFLCAGGSAILKVYAADSIQWYRNDTAVLGANGSEFQVTNHGVYYAILYSNTGCTITSRRQVVLLTLATPPTAAFTISSAASQCLVGNRFTFTNTSNNTPAVTYRWQMGDSTELTTKDAVYTYRKAGTYKVFLLAENLGCAATAEQTVHVYQNPVPVFSASPVCINQPATLINNTVDSGSYPVSYLWKFSNGQTSSLRNPPVPVYAVAGVYPIVLSVSNAQCPALNAVTRNLVVARPAPAISYPMQYALANTPILLQARQTLGTAFLWSPGNNLSNRAISNPIFKGFADQTYAVAITANSGCTTIDTQVVKVIKSIEIYVPSAFTPNQDGKNDYLRPITFGATVRSFKVYNRLGQVLFEMKGSGNGWNGTTKSIPQQIQTLVWTLDALGADGKTYFRSGTTILIR